LGVKFTTRGSVTVLISAVADPRCGPVLLPVGARAAVGGPVAATAVDDASHAGPLTYRTKAYTEHEERFLNEFNGPDLPTDQVRALI